LSFLVKYLKNKKVTVLGAGVSGMAAAQLLHRKGVDVFVSESQPASSKQHEKEVLQTQNIPFEFGKHSDIIYKTDLLVVSPGISLDDTVIKKAEDKGLSVYGELEVASWYCRAPIIAVTGSNGKSTTTELIGYIFKNSGREYEIVGNIGRPFSEIADTIDSKSTAVIEVSSFQLETIKSFHPRVAIFLNISPDHLDRHGSMQIYSTLKSRIFENQTPEDFLIYNGMDTCVSDLIQDSKSQKIVFNKKSTDTPCGYIENEKLKVHFDGETVSVVDIRKMKQQGKHNAANATAAALCARVMGIEWESIRYSLQYFKGLSHRMEFVRRKNDVVWINDSKATNVDAVWYALESFNSPVILIAGGRDKDADFYKLYDQVAQKVKHMILLGEAAQKMKNVFKGISISIVASMEEAVKEAEKIAEPGDNVLLSPCCTSFDMFTNFKERGNTFKDLVNKL